MTARSPGAFMLSATFHAAIIGLVALYAVLIDQRQKITPRVLELVAGEGDNFAATEAPKLGTPGGLKVDVQPMPAPKTIEVEPVPVAPTPPPPAPVAKATPAPTKAETPIPNFRRKILHKVWAAEAKAKKEIAKTRAEEAKRLKKEEFDRMQREKAAKVASAKRGSGATKVTHIDTEGIAKGVVGGSANNKVGGAGGKALYSDGGALTDRYFAMLKQRVLNALAKPAGVSDDLIVTVVVRIAANGRLSDPRVVKSSGSEEFDRAVIEAFSRVTMPEHPEKKNEELELIFRTKDVEGG